MLYNGTRVFDVLFTTPFEDGTTVATGDSILHLPTALPPRWQFHDHYLNDVAEQWRLHLESLGHRSIAAEPMHLLPEEFAAREDADLKAAFSSLEEQGAAVREDESGHLRLRPLAAWRMVLKAQSGGRRVAIRGREKLLAGDTEPGGAPQVAADIYAFVRNEANEHGRTQSRRFKMALFLISMVGFVLAFGWLWSWRTVPLLLMVVLIHELGHLAGMALFGYRDRQILFVPFLGAAAIGRNEDATPFQKLIIYLLGPIPGIALGFACLRLGTIAGGWFWTELGIIAILINYLNLLPLAPLDGGRVVETILLSRFPRAQALFLFASACLFGLGGILAGDPVLLILAAFMALSLPAKWKWGSAARSVSRALPAGAGKRERLLAIFETLNGPRFARLQSQGKLQMAKGLMDYLQERRPGLGASFAGAALYVATLIAPIVGYGGYLASGAGIVEADAAPAVFEGPALPETKETEGPARDVRTALAVDSDAASESAAR